jgi:DNA-binding response OmpR family regulator
MKRKGYVVVIEADDLIRELLQRWLSEVGYVVVLAHAGNPPAREPPCLVIANVPDPRRGQAPIRGLQAAYAAPVLALSARFQRGLASSRNAARSVGVRRVLPKPFTRKELLLAVQECIKEPE